MNIPDAAYTISSRLVRDFNAESVWLFGSQARGDATTDSDFDFLAVVAESNDSRYRRAVAARTVVEDIHEPKDIIVLTRDEWNKELKVPSSLASTVMREGILLDGSAT